MISNFVYQNVNIYLLPRMIIFIITWIQHKIWLYFVVCVWTLCFCPVWKVRLKARPYEGWYNAACCSHCTQTSDPAELLEWCLNPLVLPTKHNFHFTQICWFEADTHGCRQWDDFFVFVDFSLFLWHWILFMLCFDIYFSYHFGF